MQKKMALSTRPRAKSLAGVTSIRTSIATASREFLATPRQTSAWGSRWMCSRSKQRPKEGLPTLGSWEHRRQQLPSNWGMTALLFVSSRQCLEYGHRRHRFSCYRRQIPFVRIVVPGITEDVHWSTCVTLVFYRAHPVNRHRLRMNKLKQIRSIYLLYIRYTRYPYCVWTEHVQYSTISSSTNNHIKKRTHSVLNRCNNLLTNNWINN